MVNCFRSACRDPVPGSLRLVGVCQVCKCQIESNSRRYNCKGLQYSLWAFITSSSLPMNPPLSSAPKRTRNIIRHSSSTESSSPTYVPPSSLSDMVNSKPVSEFGTFRR